MKYFSSLIYPLIYLTSTCNAMDVLPSPSHEDSPSRVRLRAVPASNEGAQTGDLAEGSKKRRTQKQEGAKPKPMMISSLQDINRYLARNAAVVKEELPTILTSLQTIQDELQRKSLAQKEHNFIRATDLQAPRTFALGLSKSARLIQDNLASLGDFSQSQEGISPIAGLAVGGAGALCKHLGELMEELAKSEDTSQINVQALKAASDRILRVTNNMDITAFRLTDE